jgi:hypothetical protein
VNNNINELQGIKDYFLTPLIKEDGGIKNNQTDYH